MAGLGRRRSWAVSEDMLLMSWAGDVVGMGRAVLYSTTMSSVVAEKWQ